MKNIKRKKTKTKEGLEELREKLTEVKAELLELNGRCGLPTISKQTIGDAIFKIYLKIK